MLMWRHYYDDTPKRDSPNGISHLGIRNNVSKWLRPSYTELVWFYCNDNATKRDFESQTTYSQFGMDIVIRSGIIY